MRWLRGLFRRTQLLAVPVSSYTLPHCDEFVLHGPGRCTYCDERQDLQVMRLREGLHRFTGESEPAHLLPCPSELRRPIDLIELWAGNRPVPE